MSERSRAILIVWALLIATAWIGDKLVRGILLTADQPRTVVARGDLAEFELVSTELFDAACVWRIPILSHKSVLIPSLVMSSLIVTMAGQCVI